MDFMETVAAPGLNPLILGERFVKNYSHISFETDDEMDRLRPKPAPKIIQMALNDYGIAVLMDTGEIWWQKTGGQWQKCEAVPIDRGDPFYKGSK